MVPTLNDGKSNRSYPFFTTEQQLVLIGIDAYPSYEFNFSTQGALASRAQRLIECLTNYSVILYNIVLYQGIH